MARSVAVTGAACTTGHGCDAVTTVLGGSPNVKIGNVGVLTKGDPLAVHNINNAPPGIPPCINHPGQVVNTGSKSVFVNGEPIARVGDSVDIGGTITVGNAKKVFAGG